MKFAALQGVFGEALPQVFAVAGQFGFDGVELDWRQLEEAENGALSAQHRASIRRAAQENGVEISGVAAHFLNSGGIASAGVAEQQFGMRAIQTGIELCHDLGAKVLLVPFFGAAEITDEAGIKRLQSALQQLAPQAESADVTLAIEHTLRGDVAAKVLSTVNSSHVGNYWDMANCMSLGYDPLEEISRLGEHLTRVHAKEFSGETPHDRAIGTYPGLNQMPFGSGSVPVRKVVSALREMGYDDYITLETGAFGDKHQSAKDALKVLRDALL